MPHPAMHLRIRRGFRRNVSRRGQIHIDLLAQRRSGALAVMCRRLRGVRGGARKSLRPGIQPARLPRGCRGFGGAGHRRVTTILDVAWAEGCFIALTWHYSVELPGSNPLVYQAIWLLSCRFAPSRSDSVMTASRRVVGQPTPPALAGVVSANMWSRP